MKGLALVPVLVGVLAACSSGDTAGSVSRRGSERASREPRGAPMPHEECSGDDTTTQDVNNDGQADIRTVMSSGRPRCRETDANFDGRVDIYRWFNDEGLPTRVEDDYDFDGRIDAVATFEAGVVVRDVLDTNFDGRTDTWREYRNGRVSELRRDADGDGQVDTWERFDDQGRVTFTAVDANHDGQPDAESDAGPPVTDASTSVQAVPTTTAPTSPPTTGTAAPSTTPTTGSAGTSTTAPTP